MYHLACEPIVENQDLYLPVWRIPEKGRESRSERNGRSVRPGAIILRYENIRRSNFVMLVAERGRIYAAEIAKPAFVAEVNPRMRQAGAPQAVGVRGLTMVHEAGGVDAWARDGLDLFDLAIRCRKPLPVGRKYLKPGQCPRQTVRIPTGIRRTGPAE